MGNDFVRMWKSQFEQELKLQRETIEAGTLCIQGQPRPFGYKKKEVGV